MTGFTTLLRKILCLGPPKDAWTHSSAQEVDKECRPVRLKLSIKNAQQFEVKLVYQLNPECEVQNYDVDIFIFFSSELASSDLGFYHNLWTVVKLHTPKARVSELQSCKPESLLGQLSEAVQAVVSTGQSDPKLAQRAWTLQQLLRMFCYTIRRSLRHETKRLQVKLRAMTSSDANDTSDPETENPGKGSLPLIKEISEAELDRVSEAALLLIQSVVDVVSSLQSVCKLCLDPTMPADVAETWELCEEYVLCEAEHVLLKLLWQFQKLNKIGCSPSSDSETNVIDIKYPLEAEELSVLRDKSSSDGQTSPKPSQSFDTVKHELQHDLPENGGEGGNGEAGTHIAAKAQQRLALTVHGLQTARVRRGYTDSIFHHESKYKNEKYTFRLKVLKRHAQAANSLRPRKEDPSNTLADLVGMTIAAIAMGVATFSLYAATFWAGSQYGAIYIAIIIGSYVIKDRLKEWGKRYLQPVAEWFGMEFPDAITNFVNDEGSIVGQSRQFCSVKEVSAVNKRVLELRSQGSIEPLTRHATMPEKVLVYTKKMKVFWSRINQKLQTITGLDDVMRIDVHQFCRRMAESGERHIQLIQQQHQAPSCVVQKAVCSRVYHLNVILKLKSTSLTAKQPDPSKTMHLERARLVVNQQGILRLEELGRIPLEKPIHHFVPSAMKPGRLSARASALFRPNSSGDLEKGK